MDLDRGLAYLFEVFTYMNRIDDLVVVVYGDHAPKGIFEEGIQGSKTCDKLGYSDEQCLNTPLIIWHKDEFVGESDLVSNPTDISPTLYDLFGIDYNSSHVFGNSVYSDDYEGLYFDANGNIKTNNFSFDSSSSKINHDTDEDLIMINEELNLIREKMRIFRNIIENNYFSK